MTKALARLKAVAASDATPDTIDGLMKEARAQAKKMAAYMKEHKKQDKGYEDMQREMQRLLKRMDKVDPSGKNTPFDYEVWVHSAKPFRKQKSLL